VAAIRLPGWRQHLIGSTDQFFQDILPLNNTTMWAKKLVLNCVC
jgi:hypothetical protein